MTIYGEKMFSKIKYLAKKVQKFCWMAEDWFIYQNNMTFVPSSPNFMILGKKIFNKIFKIDCYVFFYIFCW